MEISALIFNIHAEKIAPCGISSLTKKYMAFQINPPASCLSHLLFKGGSAAERMYREVFQTSKWRIGIRQTQMQLPAESLRVSRLPGRPMSIS